MRRKLRRLVAGDQEFLWRMQWSYDRDGERIVSLSVLHAVGERPRGQPLRARFVASVAYQVDTSAALPGDVRAAVDLALARGWTGKETHWLLPGAGLLRPNLELTAPTRLREWAGQAQLYALHFGNAPPEVFAASLAHFLEIPANPATEGANEVQWHSPRFFLLRSRYNSVTLYARSVADLALALETATRSVPDVTASLRALPTARVHGPGTGEVPAAEVTPPSHWASVAGATRHPGPRPTDAIFLVREASGLHLEFYMYHHDAPDRLWLWTTLHEHKPAVERRFRK